MGEREDGIKKGRRTLNMPTFLSHTIREELGMLYDFLLTKDQGREQGTQKREHGVG